MATTCQEKYVTLTDSFCPSLYDSLSLGIIKALAFIVGIWGWIVM